MEEIKYRLSFECIKRCPIHHVGVWATMFIASMLIKFPCHNDQNDFSCGLMSFSGIMSTVTFESIWCNFYNTIRYVVHVVTVKNKRKHSWPVYSTVTDYVTSMYIQNFYHYPHWTGCILINKWFLMCIEVVKLLWHMPIQTTKETFSWHVNYVQLRPTQFEATRIDILNWGTHISVVDVTDFTSNISFGCAAL